jgi:hypothetical protein
MVRAIKKTLKPISFWIIWLVALCTSCNDDAEPTRTDLLTAHDWKFDEIREDGIIKSLSGCVADNRWVYMRDRSFILNAGDTKCGSEEQFDHGTWEFLNNENTLRVQYGAAPWDLQILELRSDVLRVKDEDNRILKFEHFDD